MLKILVVDDSMIIRRNLRKMIEALGHTVIAEAKNGQEAISAYGEHQPDLVTMDITMPELDGIEATRAICKENPQAKVVMITSHGQEDKVIESVQAGASGYLLKPFDEERLLAAIAKLFPDMLDEAFYQHQSDGSLQLKVE